MSEVWGAAVLRDPGGMLQPLSHAVRLCAADGESCTYQFSLMLCQGFIDSCTLSANCLQNEKAPQQAPGK